MGRRAKGKNCKSDNLGAKRHIELRLNEPIGKEGRERMAKQVTSNPSQVRGKEEDPGRSGTHREEENQKGKNN